MGCSCVSVSIQIFLSKLIIVDENAVESNQIYYILYKTSK